MCAGVGLSKGSIYLLFELILQRNFLGSVY